MREALDLCVSCKGCKRDCPTGVDMAKMKIEARCAWVEQHGITLRERLLAYLPRYAPHASRWPWLMAPLSVFHSFAGGDCAKTIGCAFKAAEDTVREAVTRPPSP